MMKGVLPKGTMRKNCMHQGRRPPNPRTEPFPASHEIMQVNDTWDCVRACSAALMSENAHISRAEDPP